MIQALVVNQGGVVSTYFAGRRPVTCTVTVTKSDNSVVVTGQSCTVDPVNTTLSVGSFAGDFSVTLTSATGVTTRARYLLGDEELTIKSVASNVVQLWAPLMRDHISTTPFQGLGVSTTIASNSTTTVEWYDGVATFTADNGVSQSEVIDCVLREIPEKLIGEINVRNVLPKLLSSVSQELDLLVAFDEARNNMLIDLGGKVRANAFVGVDHFRRLCAYQFILDRELDFGAEWALDFDKVRAEKERIKAAISSQDPQSKSDGTTNTPVGDGAMPVINFGRW